MMSYPIEWGSNHEIDRVEKNVNVLEFTLWKEKYLL